MRPLSRKELSSDPIRQFGVWFRQVKRARRVPMPDAMCLSTVRKDGAPEGRLVLLKGFSRSGFVFYTNLESPKAQALLARPRAALTFYWEPPGRQVRVVGRTRLVSKQDADAYFQTRPRMSQIGAWASIQSAPLPDRSILDSRVAQLMKEFAGKKIPRPANWTGFRVEPEQIEFWQKGDYRLNDRFLYKRSGGRWRITRLYP